MSIWRPSLILPTARRLWTETDGGVLQGIQDGCATCGCETCSIFSDNFDRADDTNLGADWTEVSGSWEIASNTLRTSSTSAVCVTDSGQANIHVAVDLQGAQNDLLRVILGYSDASNYYFVEVKIGAATTGSGGYIRLYQRSGGTNTQLCGVTTAVLKPSISANVAICASETDGIKSLTASINSVVLLHYFHTITTETTCGVGTGGTASSSIQFDNFVVNRANDNCTECRPGCAACDPAPWAYDVTLPNLTTGRCAKCAGTYTGQTYRLERCGENAFGTICAWIARIDTSCTYTVFPGGTEQVWLHFQILRDSGTWYAQLRMVFRPGRVPGVPGDADVDLADCLIGNVAIAYGDVAPFFRYTIGTTLTDCATTYNIPYNTHSFGPCTCVDTGDCVAVAVPVF